MDKTLSEIIRTFNHIVRDFFIYFVSGAVVFLNILVIDYFYYEQSFYKTIDSNLLISISLIFCYVIGHICMAFYYTVLEFTGFNQKVQKCKKIDITDEKSLPELYKKDVKLYIHFIERYDNLALMRWNLSSAFFINFLITFIYTNFIQNIWQISLLKVLFIIFSIIMYLLYLETEKDYIKKIILLKNIKS